jgi:hypothetical protein
MENREREVGKERTGPKTRQPFESQGANHKHHRSRIFVI